MLNIVPYSKKYLKESVDLFIAVYSDEKGTWSVDKATEYLSRDVHYGLRYCFVAIDGEKYLGSIFCFLCPSYDSDLLFIDSLQVWPKYRKRGVAAALMKTVLDKAQSENIKTVNLWTETSKHFPAEWYFSLGFNQNHWVEYELSLEVQ